MSYKCEVCLDPVAAGKKRRVYAVKRWDNSIEKEIPVCERCEALLYEGVPMKDLVRLAKDKPQKTRDTAINVPVPLPAPVRPTFGNAPTFRFNQPKIG